ncbi:TIGR03915 family putative DNA repair protein [Marinitoga litoralis]|uniref:TIGR03915 family putative DNA repair protein n=1 Tax=Marinitoga litoralis TaxID=570855 RepID=UPI00195FEA85|nr:TIGR03915 family putative DNA repair protein [Marinitoga litoralis]MBM7559968.1 putative DNA metabolism protein [Marinitoga litoralis]
MNIYTYDGTFPGFLSLIYYCYNMRKIPDIIFKNHNPTIFNLMDSIKTDYEKSRIVIAFIIHKLSKDVLRNIYLAYLSEIENIEVDIIKYFNLSIKLNENAEFYIDKDYVLNVKNAIHKVLNETHKFKGLLRFRELKDNTLYAPFEPDHNIITLLSSHFKDRLKNENWVIHDLRRNLALVYKNGKIELFEVVNNKQNFYLKEENLSYLENEYQIFWKNYFISSEIRERLNPKLQRQFMPKRYWKYLTEF